MEGCRLFCFAIWAVVVLRRMNLGAFVAICVVLFFVVGLRMNMNDCNISTLTDLGLIPLLCLWVRVYVGFGVVSCLFCIRDFNYFVLFKFCGKFGF